jgi:long-subunit fatty acid transport protein
MTPRPRRLRPPHRQRPSLAMRLLTALPALALLTPPRPHGARAAGLEFPESGAAASMRGGAAVSGVSDPTAAFLNPGALSRLKGLQLTYNHNIIQSAISFTRAQSQIPVPPHDTGDVGRAPVSNDTPWFFLNGLVAVSHDFNTPFTFAASVYGPNSGGSASYDVSGGQRYMMTGLDGLLAFAGLSAAYGEDTWGVGVTAQYALMPNMTYRMVVDGGSASNLSPYESEIEVEAEVKVSDMFAYSAIVGAWFRPTPSFEVAASGRVIPVRFNATGSVAVSNTPNGAQYAPEQLAITGGGASFDITLPPTARLGLRYRGLEGEGEEAVERFDVELAFVYEAWHMMDTFNVDLQGTVALFGTPLTPVVIEKRWRDTFSARLGGTYRLTDAVALSAGGFYEQGATPKQYAHIDFPSFDRFGAAGGLTLAAPGGVEVLLGYLHIFESSVTVSEQEAKVLQQRPIAPCPDACEGYSGVPVNAGRTTAAFRSFSLGLRAAF